LRKHVNFTSVGSTINDSHRNNHPSTAGPEVTDKTSRKSAPLKHKIKSNSVADKICQSLTLNDNFGLVQKFVCEESGEVERAEKEKTVVSEPTVSE